MPGHLLHLWNLTVKDVLRNYAEKNWPFSFQISGEDAMATSEQKNPSGSLSSWRNCTSLWVRFLWHSRKNYMDSQLSASICSDMVINADVLILPAMQPAQVSDSLNKSR